MAGEADGGKRAACIKMDRLKGEIKDAQWEMYRYHYREKKRNETKMLLHAIDFKGNPSAFDFALRPPSAFLCNLGRGGRKYVLFSNFPHYCLSDCSIAKAWR